MKANYSYERKFRTDPLFTLENLLNEKENDRAYQKKSKMKTVKNPSDAECSRPTFNKSGTF